jgi:hypothetical protein
VGDLEAVEPVPSYQVLPTLHGPLALVVAGELLVADQGSDEANDAAARLAHAAYLSAS